MQRDIFASEHDEFRDMVRAFIAKEVTPYHDKWEEDWMVSRTCGWRPGVPGCSGSRSTRRYGGGGRTTATT